MVREVALQVMLWIFFPSLVLLLLFLRLLSRFWNSVDKRINSYEDLLTWFNKTHDSFYSFKKQISHFQSWKQGGKKYEGREGGKYVVLDINIAILMLRVQRIQGCKMSLPQLNLSSSTACTQSAASIHCRPGLTVNLGKRVKASKYSGLLGTVTGTFTALTTQNGAAHCAAGPPAVLLVCLSVST